MISCLLFFLQFLTKCLLSGIFKIGLWLLGTPQISISINIIFETELLNFFFFFDVHIWIIDFMFPHLRNEH